MSIHVVYSDAEKRGPMSRFWTFRTAHRNLSVSPPRELVNVSGLSVKSELASGEREHKAYGILLKAIEAAKVTDYPIAFLMRALENVAARPDIVQALVAAQLKLSQVGVGIYEASFFDNINVKEALDLIKGRGLRPAENKEVDVYEYYRESQSQADIVLKPDSISTGVLFPGQAILCFEGFVSNVLERQTRTAIRDFGALRAYRVINPKIGYEEAINLLQSILPAGEILATMANTGGQIKAYLDDWFYNSPVVIPAGDGSGLVHSWERFEPKLKPHVFNPSDLPRVTVAPGTVITTLSLH